MSTRLCVLVCLVGLSGAAVAADLARTNSADDSFRQFLETTDRRAPSYRAVRRLEAEHGNRRGWLEATTEYSPAAGFRYQVTAEGGSSSIRSKVLRAVLEGERQAIARGEYGRSALDATNYDFEPTGVDANGLANVLVYPRRKERLLVAGRMFLQPDGELVRLEGRLVKSPSFWIRRVEIVRTYTRLAGAVLPVSLESRAEVRFAGSGTLRMSYTYSEVEGRQVWNAAVERQVNTAR